MDELIKSVSEKAGITADQAKNAVTSVIDFVKAKAPMIGEQLKGFLAGGGEGGGLSGAADAVKKKLGLG